MSPKQEHQHRLTARQARHEELSRQEKMLGNARVATFVAALILLYFSLAEHVLSAWWVTVPIAVFWALLIWHEKVTRSLIRARRSVAFYHRGIARLEHRWIGTGQSGARFEDEKHPSSADLDLFGKGSLFELLCTARTRTGEDTLAAWLKAPATPAEVRERQAGVEELRAQLDLREDLALLGSEVEHGVDFDGLITWGKEPPVLVSQLMRWTIFVIGAAAVFLAIAWLVLDWSFALLGGIVFIEAALQGAIHVRVQKVIGAVAKKARDLAMLAGVLARLEQESFDSPRLQRLRQSLEESGAVPSHRIGQLCNLIDLLQSRKNQLFAPFALLLMWGAQIAFSIERWRMRSGASIEKWLTAVGQFEALGSFATFAFENPEYPFPEIVDEGGARIEGTQLGHPLIPAVRCVRNDLTLNDQLQVLVVSGSNMSGKSTMLRTVGINAALALAGAPVCAEKLRVSPLVAGATLRIEDSLQAGQSRFYAEILRVRQVVDLARGQPPLLFLLDEIFHGTNSHDRRIGAEAIVKGLVNAGAIGLVTTHDLSLTHVVDAIGSRAANVHFEDHLENGQMVFDYRMRPGVVQKSNALALMRAVGLEV